MIKIRSVSIVKLFCRKQKVCRKLCHEDAVESIRGWNIKKSFNELLIWSICHVIQFRVAVFLSDVSKLFIWYRRHSGLTCKCWLGIYKVATSFKCHSKDSRLSYQTFNLAVFVSSTLQQNQVSRLNFKFH